MAESREAIGVTEERIHHPETLLIVDDEIAFLGGINIGDEIVDKGANLGWADLALAIRGPLCARLGAMIRHEALVETVDPILMHSEVAPCDGNRDVGAISVGSPYQQSTAGAAFDHHQCCRGLHRNHDPWVGPVSVRQDVGSEGNFRHLFSAIVTPGKGLGPR